MQGYTQLAFGVSLLAHAVLLTGVPSLSWDRSESVLKKPKEIEIFPEKIEKMNDPKPVHFKQIQAPPPFVDDFMKAAMNETKKMVSLPKPRFTQTEIKEIMLSDIPKGQKLKKNPAYLDYYRMIREKIRKEAYHNYQGKESGEVSLTFVIMGDGRLESFRLNNTSSPVRRLRQIAVESVESSSPFPEFPEELQTHARLLFSIDIYFKNN